MAIIIGGPNNPNAYVYNPEKPRDTSKKVKKTPIRQNIQRSPFRDEPIRGPIPSKDRRRLNDPADQLQFLVEQKDSLKNLPSSRSSDLNAYQDAMQNFILSSPQAAAAYKERFPITSFIQNMAPMAVGAATGAPIGIMSALNKKRKEIAAKDKGVLGAIASIPGKIAEQFQKQPKDKNTSTQDKNIDIIKEELGLDYSTSGAPYDQIDELPAGSVATDNTDATNATNAADLLEINTDFTYDPYSGPNALDPLGRYDRIPNDDFEAQNLQVTDPYVQSSGAPMDTGYVPPATQQEIAAQMLRDQQLRAIRNQINANQGILQNLPLNMNPLLVGDIGNNSQVFDMRDYVMSDPAQGTSFFPYGYDVGVERPEDLQLKAKGGSVDNNNVLKLINDTMHGD